MKTRLLGDSGQPYIEITTEMMEVLGWKFGDILLLDLPMAHKNMLCVEKVEQRVGDEVL